MTIYELFKGWTPARASANGDVEILSIRFDSRDVQPSCVFVAVGGTTRDGHDFIAQAARVASALVVERIDCVPDDFQGAVFVTSDARAALGQLAARFYGEPSRELFTVALTGTNGKTTTAHMIEAVLNEHGWPTGVIGTNGHHLGERHWETERTTPDPVEFHRLLREFAEAGARAVALEATSHALDQRRVDAVEFDCAVFSNLTRDHLDYHLDMESYFAAKSRLFTELLAHSAKPNRRAIVNVDDPYGARLSESLRLAGADVWTCGAGSTCDFSYAVDEAGFAGSSFRLQSPHGSHGFRVALPGAHNVENAVAAIAAGLAAGATLDCCARALERLTGVSGRLEPISNKHGLHVFVDFAHTSSALEGALRFLGETRTRSAPTARIFVVFGCGGERDKGKRPLMMQAALQGADGVILTSDNPRGEDPLAIMRDALSGAPHGATIGDATLANGAAVAARLYQSDAARIFAEPDRRLAIVLALRLAGPGDVVLIAGKGHEAHQEIAGAKRPFSDQATVRAELQ